MQPFFFPQSNAMPSTPHPSAVSLPTDKDLVLKVIPMPADCNANGDIFGGWVMAQVDLAGAVVPARYIQGRFATVAVMNLKTAVTQLPRSEFVAPKAAEVV